jgi:hypothetical protein
MSEVPARLREADKGSRVWLWKPQWYWHGWSTLNPVFIGHDEYARRTLMLGWTITGRIIIALWHCGSEECYRDAIEELEWKWIEDEA